MTEEEARATLERIYIAVEMKQLAAMPVVNKETKEEEWILVHVYPASTTGRDNLFPMAVLRTESEVCDNYSPPSGVQTDGKRLNTQ